MDKEEKFWVCIWSLTAAVLITLIICGFGDDHFNFKSAVEHGLCQTTAQGYNSYVWEKCK